MRHIEFEGPVNFRDVGGYQNADGQTVRWGAVYRSDTLAVGSPGTELEFAL